MVHPSLLIWNKPDTSPPPHASKLAVRVASAVDVFDFGFLALAVDVVGRYIAVVSLHSAAVQALFLEERLGLSIFFGGAEAEIFL